MSIHKKNRIFQFKNEIIPNEGNDIKVIKVKNWSSKGSNLMDYIRTSSLNSEFEDASLIIFSKNQNELDNTPWVFAKLKLKNILEEIKKDTVTLITLCDIEKGTSTGLNEVFIITKDLIDKRNIEGNLLKKYIRNSDLNRYLINYQDLYLIYVLDSKSLNNNPNLYQYLLIHFIGL